MKSRVAYFGVFTALALIFSYVVVHEVFGDQETHIDTALHQTILACIGIL